MSRRTVLRGGYVLTFDDRLGELASGDVLIEDDRIVDVGATVDAGDAEIVDVELGRASADRILRGIELTSGLVSDELTQLINVAAMRNLARAWDLPPAAR